MEYTAIYLGGRLVGPSVAIRYLRNPNPLVAVRLLRAFGATIGSGTTIKGSIFLDNVERDAESTGDFSHLKIGDNCYIGDSVFFDLANEIVVEPDAVIAGRAAFITHAECNRSNYLSQRFPRKSARVVVSRGAWVGFGACILPGVTVGGNAVIGANSLLLENAEAECVYCGSPARKLRHL